MNYTKGKWVYNYDRCAIESTKEFQVEPNEDDDEKGVPQLVINLYGAMGGKDSDADITLICAAPTMYESLTKIINLIKNETDDEYLKFKILTIANQAINHVTNR